MITTQQECLQEFSQKFRISPVQNKQGSYYVGYYLDTAEYQLQPRSNPAICVVILDRSESMGPDYYARNAPSPRLDCAKKLLLEFVLRLQDDAIFSMTCFNDQVQTIQTPCFIGQNRQTLLENIQNINATGGTDIPLGFVNGIKSLEDSLALARQKYPHITEFPIHMLFFTDGQETVSEIERQAYTHRTELELLKLNSINFEFFIVGKDVKAETIFYLKKKTQASTRMLPTLTDKESLRRQEEAVFSILEQIHLKKAMNFQARLIPDNCKFTIMYKDKQKHQDSDEPLWIERMIDEKFNAYAQIQVIDPEKPFGVRAESSFTTMDDQKHAIFCESPKFSISDNIPIDPVLVFDKTEKQSIFNLVDVANSFTANEVASIYRSICHAGYHQDQNASDELLSDQEKMMVQSYFGNDEEAFRQALKDAKTLRGCFRECLNYTDKNINDLMRVIDLSDIDGNFKLFWPDIQTKLKNKNYSMEEIENQEENYEDEGDNYIFGTYKKEQSDQDFIKCIPDKEKKKKVQNLLHHMNYLRDQLYRKENLQNLTRRQILSFCVQFLVYQQAWKFFKSGKVEEYHKLSLAAQEFLANFDADSGPQDMWPMDCAVCPEDLLKTGDPKLYKESPWTQYVTRKDGIDNFINVYKAYCC